MWVAFAKTLTEWEHIWPAFVKREEARAGKERCVSFVLTDNHKVHTQDSMVRFNEDRGIQTTTAAPYSQWQDPAERVIQTVTSSSLFLRFTTLSLLALHLCRREASGVRAGAPRVQGIM